MSVFEMIKNTGHEQVVFCNEPSVGLKAIIAIHNTQLGPALGGCRVYPYATEEDALFDVLRLSEGMTKKAACAGLDLGGGKSIIIGDPNKLASEAFFRAFGRFVDSLGGRYITAEDIGTSVERMEWVRRETRYVTGIPTYIGGSGDPSPVTAHGVFCGLKAGVKYKMGKDCLKGVRVGVEGIGNVGYYLCKELHAAGAILFVTDINKANLDRAVNEFGATYVAPEDFYKADVDVYAPCALGATLNDQTIPMLKCSVIAGGANNQLRDTEVHGKAVMDRGILYAPDYVINAGGLINVYSELKGSGPEHAWAKTEKIYDTLLKLFAIADEKKITTHKASEEMAKERIQSVVEIRNIFTFNEEY